MKVSMQVLLVGLLRFFPPNAKAEVAAVSATFLKTGLKNIIWA